MRVHLCAYFFDIADGGNPFAKGNAAAKASADADGGVRAALALFAPSLVGSAHRHARVLQTGLAALLKLAGTMLALLKQSMCHPQSCAFEPAPPS